MKLLHTASIAEKMFPRHTMYRCVKVRLPVQRRKRERIAGDRVLKMIYHPASHADFFNYFPSICASCRYCNLLLVVCGIGCVRKWVRDVYYLRERTHSHRTPRAVFLRVRALFALSSVNHLNPLRNIRSD